MAGLWYFETWQFVSPCDTSEKNRRNKKRLINLFSKTFSHRYMGIKSQNI